MDILDEVEVNVNVPNATEAIAAIQKGAARIKEIIDSVEGDMDRLTAFAAEQIAETAATVKHYCDLLSTTAKLSQFPLEDHRGESTISH